MTETEREKERERKSLFTITKQKHKNKPILHKFGGLPEGHTPITAGYPLLISTTGIHQESSYESERGVNTVMSPESSI